MRALVTGASGFVGRWLTRALRADGVVVTALAFDGVPSGEPDGVAGAAAQDDAALAPITWRVGDLRDDRFVADAVDTARADLVVHLAAISHVPTATAEPTRAWDVNVTASARLLQHVIRLRDAEQVDPTVLIVGSAEQYGRQDAERIREDAVQAPRTVYAATKAAQEVMALQLWRSTGVRVVLARSFNHSGPGQEPRFLLPALVSRAMGMRAAPPGSPMAVGNTTPVRDFLHVSDVVSAYIALLRRGTPGEAYNVASGTGRSVQAVIDHVLARTGVRATLTTDPALVRPVDVSTLVGDPNKLQLATGWRAERAFDDIIDDLIHATTH